jgi:glycosyltransferase involved in cell wall biosynthesis
MNELLVVLPTRNRPENVNRFVRSFQQTADMAHLVLVVDSDDDSYDRLELPGVSRITLPHGPVSAKVNFGAGWALDGGYRAVAFFGDDSLFHTPHWDTRIMEALDAMGGSGMVYVNDLGRSAVPCNMTISSDIVRALGYFDEPTMNHYFVDDVWKDLGLSTRCLAYLEDVVVEHLHWVWNKSPRDEVYLTTQAANFDRDSAAFDRWYFERAESDRAKVEQVLRGGKLWSILVPTHASRHGKFERLMRLVLPQVDQAGGRVEVVALHNTGAPLPELRTRLIDAAKGEFVSFIDDDDLVAEDYVDQVVAALADPKVDYVGFEMECHGLPGRRCLNSTQYHGWYDHLEDEGLVYYRDYNHVCVIRTELVRQGYYGDDFIHGTTGEDRQIKESVLPILRRRFKAGQREQYIDKVMYYYLWHQDDSTQTGMRPVPDEPRPEINSPFFRWLE